MNVVKNKPDIYRLVAEAMRDVMVDAYTDGLEKRDDEATWESAKYKAKEISNYLEERIPFYYIVPDKPKVKERITTEKVKEMRSQGKNFRQIGEHFGVTRQYAHYLLNN